MVIGALDWESRLDPGPLGAEAGSLASLHLGVLARCAQNPQPINGAGSLLAGTHSPGTSCGHKIAALPPSLPVLPSPTEFVLLLPAALGLLGQRSWLPGREEGRGSRETMKP